MHSFAIPALLLSFASAVFSANCTSGLYIVVARGSGEKQGEGVTAAIAKMIEAEIPNSTSVGLVYPATLGNYIQSEEAGVTALQSVLDDYVASCPDGKIALLGYSQGAQVIGDVLCGASEAIVKPTAALPARFNDSIVAAIQMGDPSFVPGLPYDAGTSKIGGIFNRTNTAGCDPWATRIQSYCDTNDLFCASGTSLIVHFGYISNYAKNASKFVVDMYNAAKANGDSTGGNSTGGDNGNAASFTHMPSSAALAALIGLAFFVGL